MIYRTLSKCYNLNMFPKKISEIPKDIRLMTYATTIRWIGWGFVEALIPIFLLAFTSTYAETGWLKSSYDIAYLIAAPIVGALTDKMSARIIIFIGLAMYPFIGLSYYLAGVFGMIGFVILARILNGIGYAFDSIGRATYIRRHVPQEKTSTIFGYFDAVTTFWWILAVLSSLFLIKYFSIYQIFLAIIPTTFLAIFMMRKIHHHNPTRLKDGFKNLLKENIIVTTIKELRNWGGGLRVMALVTFWMGVMAVIAGFILPLRIWDQSGELQKVILIEVFTALPFLLSLKLGRIADKNRIRALIFGLLTTFIFTISFAFTSDFYLQLALGFFLALSGSLIFLSVNGITTSLSEAGHYGRMSGLTDDIDTIGALVAPPLLGFSIDRFGFNETFIFLSVGVLVILTVVLLNTRKLKEVKIK